MRQSATATVEALASSKNWPDMGTGGWEGGEGVKGYVWVDISRYERFTRGGVDDTARGSGYCDVGAEGSRV